MTAERVTRVIENMIHSQNALAVAISFLPYNTRLNEDLEEAAARIERLKERVRQMQDREPVLEQAEVVIRETVLPV